MTGVACLELGLFVIGAVVTVWTLAYVFNPDIRSATNQLGQELWSAAKRWKEKRTWGQGHLIHENDIQKMEMNAQESGDDGKIPIDKNWCLKNPKSCIGLVTGTVIGLTSIGYNSIVCGAEAGDTGEMKAKKGNEFLGHLSRTKNWIGLQGKLIHLTLP